MKLFNDPNDAAAECVEGIVETYPGLQYLEGFPHIKVVFRADISGNTYDKVAVISGGGSGHEPAHAGYVGEGMLTAAICGDVFSSPPVDAVLAAIRTVTGPKGCLLIVKNYTNDRLNFGLAAEEAKSEGYNVEMVIVGDDCAITPPQVVVGRRGLAGTILVHKVAGAAAAAGHSLAEVAAEAEHASEIVGTMAVATSICTQPGQLKSERLNSEMMELGIGIDTKYVPITRGDSVVMMINGLGATPLMELMIAASRAVPLLPLEHGLAVDRVYTGSFFTSIDMTGFSISLMRADPTILQRLDAPTKAPFWPVGAEGFRTPIKIPVQLPPSRVETYQLQITKPEELSEQGRTIQVAIKAAANEIILLRRQLDEWDEIVGDGDCGTVMFRGATAILEDMNRYLLNDAARTVKQLGHSIRRVMGGTSGTLYKMLSIAAYLSLKEAPTITSKQLGANALEASIAAISKYGGAGAGHRTMLDALIPAVTVLKERLDAGENPVAAFVLSAKAAWNGAESTVNMKAQVTSFFVTSKKKKTTFFVS
ncbi:Putative 3,4-dihydroxy-2-butanone kinase [Apostasia shenzhenica]|uniref:3,4-dihydroxy-2-butanone kinase n=1 Tax=Apostasia shenzhenica TaxID=1088818 RepID=A0A2I0A9K2_9ASPA|nr:Putative 3,4-dihydroxy-2-butanone kinase [Apostasia shenzhenica]